jgi:hypothetical protein
MAFNSRRSQDLALKHAQALIEDGTASGCSLEDMLGAAAIVLAAMVDAANFGPEFASGLVQAALSDIKRAQEEAGMKPPPGQGVN